MTIAVEERSILLPWDAFLEADVQASVPDASRWEASIKMARQHIEAFRRVDWPNIRRELSSMYNWVIDNDVEPHWVAPGKAVLWQEQIVRQPVEGVDKDGRPERHMTDVNFGWQATLPQTANNANLIARHLNKGLRLRPPHGDVSVETYLEAAGLSETPQEEPPMEMPFVCDRHPRARRNYRFATWKQYLRHCAHYMESPAEEAPEQVLAKMARYKFYCGIHDVGFQYKKAASRHLNAEMKKPGRPVHPSMIQMTMVPKE